MGRFKNRPLGVVLYEGPSRINGKPIVCIATFRTDNEKTGNLIQTWILSAEVNPIEAINTGEDDAACGDCPLRGIVISLSESDYKGHPSHRHETINRFRGCYVAVQNAPRNVWFSWQKGLYPKYSRDEHSRWFKGRGLRLGSYGEPVAVPLTVWLPLLRICGKSKPGYTHQWRKRKFQSWKKYIMASTHSEGEVIEANNLGWRSYRVRQAEESILSNETICPASEEGGYRETCESCGACNGGNPRRQSIVTIVHGSLSKLSAMKRVG